MSHTRPAETRNEGALKRELARLKRENQLLRSQLRTKTPIPQSTKRLAQARLVEERFEPLTIDRRGAVTPTSLAPHTMVAERYELECLLARGGMGAVWVARDLHTDDRVAVKFLRGEAGPDRVARFEREAEVCTRLQSKHVVRVLGHGVDGGNHYLAMELLRGESLSSLLRRTGRLTLSEACQLVADLAQALHPAHEAGIVHRDLKPQNLFISVGEGGDRTLKLLDFGVAKRLEDTSDMTTSGVIIGSPNYMSPEQAYGTRTIDHKSDLWAVGVILYRVLTGRRPWEGDNPLELLYKVCTEPAPPPSSHDPQLHAAIDAFFNKALAHAPENRFASIEDLAAAFIAAARTPSTPPPVAPAMRSPLPSTHSSADAVDRHRPALSVAPSASDGSPRGLWPWLLLSAVLAIVAGLAVLMLT